MDTCLDYVASIASLWWSMIDNRQTLVKTEASALESAIRAFPRHTNAKTLPSAPVIILATSYDHAPWYQTVRRRARWPTMSILQGGIAMPERRTNAAVSIAHARQPQTRARCSPTIYATYAAKSKQPRSAGGKKSRP